MIKISLFAHSPGRASHHIGKLKGQFIVRVTDRSGYQFYIGTIGRQSAWAIMAQSDIMAETESHEKEFVKTKVTVSGPNNKIFLSPARSLCMQDLASMHIVTYNTRI